MVVNQSSLTVHRPWTKQRRKPHRSYTSAAISSIAYLLLVFWMMMMMMMVRRCPLYQYHPFSLSLLIFVNGSPEFPLLSSVSRCCSTIGGVRNIRSTTASASASATNTALSNVRRWNWNPNPLIEDGTGTLFKDVRIEKAAAARTLKNSFRSLWMTSPSKPPIRIHRRLRSQRRRTPLIASSSSPKTESTKTTPTLRSNHNKGIIVEQRRGGGSQAASAQHHHDRPLVFWENMVAGAISRSIAQTIMHPANTLKTILQANRPNDTTRALTVLDWLTPQHFRRLTVGAGANFILSVPHGAVNFAVLEFVRTHLSALVDASPYLTDEQGNRLLGPTLDFVSSCISTITCSAVSTPQMVIADNIMVGNYPNLRTAIQGLAAQRGIAGFYTGWWPGLVGKIPSYALTWTFFQQLKQVRDKLSTKKDGHGLIITTRPATDFENSIMGCIASGATVCIMIPLDTIKTRLVTQASRSAVAASQHIVVVPYKGILDCAMRVAKEEGVSALYRGLTPRLISVMPMIGIQFGVYEYMKKTLLERDSYHDQHQHEHHLAHAQAQVQKNKNKSKSKSKSKSKNVPSFHYDRTYTLVSNRAKRLMARTRTTSPVQEPMMMEYGSSEALQEAAMEVAASPEVPFPAPRFLHRTIVTQIQKARNSSSSISRSIPSNNKNKNKKYKKKTG